MSNTDGPSSSSTNIINRSETGETGEQLDKETINAIKDAQLRRAEGTAHANSRIEMVQAARKFFMNPKVRSTPFQEQKQFLMDKGVTSAEIDEALSSISPVEVAASALNPQNTMVINQAQSSSNKLLTITQSVVMIGGASYMAYKLVRSWILPRFFGVADPADEQMQNLQTQINELQNSTKFIMDSVEQTLQTVSAQQEQLNRALLLISHNGGKESDLNRLQTDIAIIKSLLLNQNQFPAIPVNSNGPSILNGPKKDNRSVSFAEQIPSWQLEHDNQNQNENKGDLMNGEV